MLDHNKVTDGAGFCLAHQQMFGVAFFYWLAGKLFGNENKKNKGKKVKRIPKQIRLRHFHPAGC